MYHFIERCHTLYKLLQDEQSKDIFRARFAIDMERSVPNMMQLVSLGNCKEHGLLGWNQPRKEILKKLNREHKRIILYGTARMGQRVAKILEFEHIDFYGFCGRDAKEFPDGLLGKPVLSPDELVAHGDGYYVELAVGKESYLEISQFLHDHKYPAEHILEWLDPHVYDKENQYFEFPELYRRGTAYIDGGCLDCQTSYRFAKWCGGAYSSIIAFEPDPYNYAQCCKNMQDDPLPNFQLINAGLSSQEGTLLFESQGTGSSHIISSDPPAEPNLDRGSFGIKNIISVRTVAIDDIIGDRTVGFIKMDIEGAEFDALHGAKNTILRDKPLLAICVYHLRGDVFAIMDYLHQLVSEYRFWLRHYGAHITETVLYASVDLQHSGSDRHGT